MNFLKENWPWILSPMALIFGFLTWFIWFSSVGEPATLHGTQRSALTIPTDDTWSMSVTVNRGEAMEVAIKGGKDPITMRQVADAIDALKGVSAELADGALQLTTDATGMNASLQITPGPTDRDLAAACGLSTAFVTAPTNEVAPHQYPMFD